MSKMKDLLIQIEEYLSLGYKPQSVAAMLNCPIDWVYEAVNMMQDEEGTHQE